ncbi:transposase [Agrilactobacillus composti DSM 18527 = JCM 14202]|uniref:Transposase n=1 Tax=Agrilactobacillus composti DSM 18527 = JCM 14202 TaxID=1423734 RepID=X0PUD0_9LACO|nr:IS1380 family transposase [Agrilactobacillus composti]KRM34385.1 transposase [Agrilactobacillus composti DSM 18527 = JCM 14202]GAF41707.1 translation initiation factor 2 [Agrilactobacillus composti DSM 18527 = JCM 14202]
MYKLRQKTLKSNPKIQIDDLGNATSSNTGLILVHEYLNKTKFLNKLYDILKFNDDRYFSKYPETSILHQAIYQLVAGYNQDRDANALRYDPIFQAILPHGVVSQSTFSRFLDRLARKCTLKAMHKLMASSADDYINANPDQVFTLDADSTNSATYGHQENSSYNFHYHAKGYHPFVVFLAGSGLLVDAELRPGNVYTSKDADKFLKAILKRHPDQKFIVRTDSGFADPKIYDMLEKRQADYVIRLKSNVRLVAQAQKLFRDNPGSRSKEIGTTYFYRSTYQARSWKHPRQIIVMATLNKLLVPNFQFFITTLDTLAPEEVVKVYRHRGTMENYIKELKNGFYFDKTDSPKFAVNEVRMLLSAIAYNIIKSMENEVFPTSNEKKVLGTINTIRLKLMKIGATFAYHARRLQIHLTSSNPYDDLFWQVFDNIQMLS